MIKDTPEKRSKHNFWMLDSLYSRLQQEAKKENRSVANLIELWLLEKIKSLDKKD